MDTSTIGFILLAAFLFFIGTGGGTGSSSVKEQNGRYYDRDEIKLIKILDKIDELKLKKEELIYSIQELENDPNLDNDRQNELKIRKHQLELNKIDMKIFELQNQYRDLNDRINYERNGK